MTKKIDDLAINIRIFENETNIELGKEKKATTILSFHNLISNSEFILKCYSLVSFQNSTTPKMEEIISMFISEAKNSALKEAAILMQTPEETYPVIEINKNLLDFSDSGLVFQRIGVAIDLLAEKHLDEIRISLRKFLLEENMAIDNPVNIEVW